MKHNNTLIEAILITYRSLTRKLPFKSAHLISIGDVYLLTVNALMRTHVQLGHRIRNEGHSAVQHVSLCLCSLLAATSQFSIPIGQKMQLTG